MGSLIEIINHQAESGNQSRRQSKPKTSFWASESEAMAFDIFHKWMGTPPTNPMEGETVMMLTMRKMSEVAAVSLMRKAGILVKRFANDERMYFEWGQHKVPISGYPDAGVWIDNEVAIVEIKTFYGTHHEMDISAGRVKLPYLKQLAIYMYHHKIRHGILLMINQGTGTMYEFDLYQNPDNPYHFACPDNEVEFNLEETFKRWEKIYVENILQKKEPAIEYRYKYDLKTLDWSKVSAADISAARNNKKVLGDWQVKYSDYKDLVISREGTVPGYTDEELDFIRTATAGYSQRNSGLVKFEAPAGSDHRDIKMPAKPLIIK